MFSIDYIKIGVLGAAIIVTILTISTLGTISLIK